MSFTNINSCLKMLMAFAFFIGYQITFAGKEPELRSFKLCSALSPSDTLLVYDQLFLNATGGSTGVFPSGYHLFNTTNLITLEVDQNTVVDCTLPQFDLTAVIQIDRLDAFGNVIGSSQTVTLNINYDKTLVEKYKEKHTLTFQGGYWYKAQIVSITPSNTAALPFVKLSIGTQIERYKDINQTVIPSFNPALYNANNNEITFYWNNISGAEEYDLEWVWYDDYTNTDVLSSAINPAAIEYSFKNNATRVTVKGNSYSITPAFERGYLIARVRAVGYTGATFTHRVEGAWSSQNYGPKIQNVSGNSFVTGNDRLYIDNISNIGTIKEHEPKLNWQYSSVFAEEGKKKEIIAYFDGSLHNRQTVTKVNTDHQAIVGETVYDQLGRPAVNILPAPAFENKLKFYPGFNLSQVSNLPYSKSDFDYDDGTCNNPVNPLSNNSGAGLYYSSNNPLSINTSTRLHNEYIPNSFGYPFTVTEYTPDATGRVRRQGGVGTSHQLGTGHETKYYYARPDQEELDMLFGNSVGYQYHYQKNMVVDPNGQVSISYLDLSGKVIATALAGNSPNNVQPLASSGSSVNITVDAKSIADLQEKNDQIVSNRVFTVPMQSDYTIKYGIDIPRHTDASKPNLCFDCVYDLEISLMDECGNELLDGDKTTAGNQAFVRTLGKINNAFDTLCETQGLSYSFTNDQLLNNQDIVINLPIGSYSLVKKLRINYEALEFYESKFMNFNPSLKSEKWYKDHYKAKIDYSNCDITCDSCEIKLGTRQAYIDKQTLKLQALEITLDANDLNAFNSQYDELLAFCNELCNTTVNTCNTMLDVIKQDLMPGGQYALYDNVNQTYSGLLIGNGTNGLKFNYHSYWLNSGTYNEPEGQIKYTDSKGQLIQVKIDGQIYKPNDLSSENYVKYFEPDWVNSLVTYHPEYCKYQYCLADKASNTYDNNMLNAITWQEALDSGFIDPLRNVSNPFYNASKRIDPFFVGSGRGVNAKSALISKLNNYENLDPIGGCVDMSLLQLVYVTYICDVQANSNCNKINACLTALDWNKCEPYKDKMWGMYKAIYLAEKQKIKDQIAASNNCNGVAEGASQVNRFMSVAEMEGNLSSNNNSRVIINEETTPKIAAQCETNCKSQASMWMRNFDNCVMTAAAKDTLEARLIRVCRNSCDVDHPFGASNVPNGRKITVGPSARSFKDVFDNMVSAGLITKIPGICDINSLTVMPYEHNDINHNILPADTNRCDSAWVNAPNCIKNDKDASRKLSMAATIPIDDKTACKKCIDCEQFNLAVKHLFNEYNQNFWDTSYANRQVATNVINKYLKFNLTWFDYEDFARKCLENDGIERDTLLRHYNKHFISYAINDLPKQSVPVLIPKNNSNTYYTEAPTKPYNFLFASNNNTFQINNTPTRFVSACMCNQMAAIAVGNNNQAAFNAYFSGPPNNCTPSNFDYWAVFQKCKEAFSADEDNNPNSLNSTSNWSQTQKTALENIGLMDEIEVPDCGFDCNDPNDGDHPYQTNPYLHPPVSSSIPRGGTGGTITPQPERRYLPCDSFKMFVNQLKNIPPFFIDLTRIFNDFTYKGKLTPADTNALNIVMDQFYSMYPHLYRENGFSGMDKFKAFLHMYSHCMSKNSNNANCCYSKTPYAYLLEKLFNSYTSPKGALGNYFAYSGWNIVPVQPDYYQTKLYKTNNTACSATLKHRARNNRLPHLQFVMRDMCGDSSRIYLSFIQNLDNRINFSNITKFSNFTPVSDYACDTTHYFNVDVEVTLKNGAKFFTTLHGFAEKYKLQDTCRPRDTIKLCDRPLLQKIVFKSNCRERLETMANFHAKKAYQEYIDSVRYDFRQKYIAKCMTAFDQETYTITYPHLQYHYTLYYYDQADNLIQTVPPAGVNINNSPSFLLAVKNARDNNATGSFPSHNMATRYKYNTLNQLVWQTTPDGGASEFWYDQVGRLVVSRNAKQNATSPKSYSYTNFDPLGRITEVGEMQSSTTMTVALAFSPTSLANFINASSKKEVTRTLYDIPFGTFPSNTYFAQRNMRGRVSSIQYFETLSSGANATGTYNQAVHYTYDIHGNVDVLMREMPNLSNINQAYKTTHYEYDLVSGKVNQVIYQKQHADQFAHKYSYDGDNRIINTYTSTNMVHWDKEAHYSYYLHGPLKRTELGELKVQGVDYAYTLHGWLKGVNSTTLQEDRDIGQDGNGGSINQFVAKDVFGFSLGYYEGDHTPIGMNRTLNPLTIAQQFTPSTVGTTLGNASPNLYNGNIRHMVTAILPFMNAFNPQARAYNYDQLNRIKDAYTYNQVNLGSNIWSTTAPAVSDYEEHFSYDPNGNIMTLQRNGTTVGGGALLMDNFTYNYTSGKNQLTHVDDVVPLANYGDDIDDQLSGNYSYDEIGNLISDQAEQIQEIKWTVYGKIKSIIRSSGSTKPNLAYEYSPDGHRVYKKVTQPNGNIKETYYIRDAQGNTMSTYTYDTDTFRWSESHIYGSSRIGVYNAEQVLVIGNTANSSTLQANEYENIRGKRHYELSNHLGNVLAVVSDRRTGICTGNGLIAYNAEVVSATDYYAFGSPMPGRQGIQQCSTVTNTVNVTNYSAQEDFSSSSVGGFVAGSGSRSVSNPTGNVLRLESIWTARPLATRSVAVAANTNYTVNFDIVGYSNLSNFTENVRVRIIIPGGSTITQNYTATGSHSLYFTSVTAGNITVEISQVITGSGNYGINPFVDIDNFSVTYITTTTSTSTVCSVWDKGYRYGFNGMEKDDEIKGSENHISFNDYGLDVRLGRRFGNDPVVNPSVSTYSVFLNCPLLFIDPDGESPISIFAKAAAKLGLKKAAKETVEAAIKNRLKAYMSKGWAKELGKDAIDAIDLATSTTWWEYAIEFIPIAGDAYGAAQLGKQGYAVYKITQRFESVAEWAGKAAGQAYKRLGSNKLIGKGSDLVSNYTKKINNQGTHLSETDLAGAVKEIYGLKSGVKADGTPFQHLKEVNEALGGMKSQIDNLSKQIKSGAFEGDALKAAQGILNDVTTQYNKITNTLNSAKKAAANLK